MSSNEYELNYMQCSYYSESMISNDPHDTVYYGGLQDNTSNLTNSPGIVNSNITDDINENHEFTHDSENVECSNIVYSVNLADSIEGPHLYDNSTSNSYEKMPINQHHNVFLNENSERDNIDENDEELKTPLLQKRQLKKSCAICCCVIMLSAILINYFD